MTDSLTPRALADRYLDSLVALDPVLATALGLPDGADRLGDLSPDGIAARADLRAATLRDLDALDPGALDPDALDPDALDPDALDPDALGRDVPGSGDGAGDDERRCARLLQERLEAEQLRYGSGEELRSLGTLGSPVQDVRMAFALMPADTPDDWAVIARRVHAVPEALRGYARTLDEGRRRGLPGGPAQVVAVIDQLDEWLAAGGRGWYHQFTQAGPASLRAELDSAADAADTAVAELRRWLAAEYAPFVTGSGRDPVGRERYAVAARYWSGADLDLDEAYAWAWGEFARLEGETRAEAERVLPGAGVRAAMHHLDTAGPAVDGVDAVLAYLQDLMDGAIAALDGVHVELAEPVRRVQAMIAPAGSAAAPYYTPPSLDFSRPGRTWLPTLGRTRFPTWELISTWYHEGVPGHHLQMAQWALRAPSLSRFQTTAGQVSANLEGWALYAERLMDELGLLPDAGARLGYLDAQRMRAVRVIIDIGMHLELPIPAGPVGDVEPFHPGERWTPALAREFFGLYSGRPPAFLDSEIVRYLGIPGQAIGYKLGERAWLAGREAARAARAARGERFDLKAWHMAALSQGSLGLDDLVDELSRL